VAECTQMHQRVEMYYFQRRRGQEVGAQWSEPVHTRQWRYLIVRTGGLSRSEHGGGVHIDVSESGDV
jgi:hypothetical protein